MLNLLNKIKPEFLTNQIAALRNLIDLINSAPKAELEAELKEAQIQMSLLEVEILILRRRLKEIEND